MTVVLWVVCVAAWLVVILLGICLVAHQDRTNTLRQQQKEQETRVANLLRALTEANELLDAAQTQSSTYQNQCEQFRVMLDAANGAVETLRAQHETLVAQHDDAASSVELVSARVDEASERLAALTNELGMRQNELEAATGALQTTRDVLQNLLRQRTSALALANDEDEGLIAVMRPALDKNGVRLVELCEEVVELAAHPEITKALRGFVWSKLWLPAFQRMLKGADVWDARNAIYLLRVRSDPAVCYVGQASCLRERWYQHARKLLGVDGCGNERLYGEGLGVDDFEWCVILDNVDGGLLDEMEHYYIEWFGADSVGLNKKR